MTFLHKVTVSSSYSTMYQIIGDDRLPDFAIKIEKLEFAYDPCRGHNGLYHSYFNKNG